jgi:hypothetical protein
MQQSKAPARMCVRGIAMYCIGSIASPGSRLQRSVHDGSRLLAGDDPVLQHLELRQRLAELLAGLKVVDRRLCHRCHGAARLIPSGSLPRSPPDQDEGARTCVQPQVGERAENEIGEQRYDRERIGSIETWKAPSLQTENEAQHCSCRHNA